MADFETVHDALDHTGLTGVGSGSGVMTLIETVTLGSDGTITFDSIPSTYTDLVIVGRLRDDAAAVIASPCEMQVGASTVDSGSNYEYSAYDSRVGADGLASSSVSDTKLCYARSIIADSATAGVYSPIEIVIQDYKSTSVYKTVYAHWGTHHITDPRHGQASGVWKNSGTAIDIVTIKGASGGDLKTGSSLRLYGRS